MLKTNFLGIELKNPIIAAAGPWNRNGSRLVRSIEAGAGAVITESVVSDTIFDMRPYISCDESGAQNIRLYSELQIEDWEKEIGLAKNAGGVVIGNVSAQTPSELAYLAHKMEKYGCDAIELSVGNPAKESLEVVASHANVIFEMTKEVVAGVKVPVIVKLSQNTTNISKVAKAVKAGGGAGVSAINSVRGILSVDVESARPSLSTYGGISGEYIRPLGLASVATVAQSVDIPIMGLGGISTAEHVLQYLMLGASTAGVATAIMRNGYQIIGQIVEELEHWMDVRGYTSIEAIRGKALLNMKSFDEMRLEPVVSTVLPRPCESGCSRCIDLCTYEAISPFEDTVAVDPEKCSGCGVCTSECPAGKLELVW